MREIGQPAAVREIVREICAREPLLARLASISQHHPLGFDKYVVHATPEYQLRLHVWWPWQQQGREDIHNHRFNFCSQVIAGTLRMDLYATAEPGEEMDEYREDHVRGKGSYVFHLIGSPTVKKINTSILSTGSVNYTAAEILHRVNALGDDVTATLFLKKPLPNRHFTSVLVPRGEAPPPHTEPTALDPGEFRRLLSEQSAVLA
jgi:hypothetical protein